MKPKDEYVEVTFEEAEAFWAERNRVLRARSEALVIALVGKELAPSWWSGANLAFEGQAPSTQNIERVYGYLMRMAQGEW
jgi:hypothetical protein